MAEGPLGSIMSIGGVSYDGEKSVTGVVFEITVIVQGAVTEDPARRKLQKPALYATVHGAERVLSRKEARGPAGGARKKGTHSSGKITRAMRVVVVNFALACVSVECAMG